MEINEYPTIIEYAEAVATRGSHTARIMGQKWNAKDGYVFASKGGFCYAVTDLTGDDPSLVACVRRTAALAR